LMVPNMDFIFYYAERLVVAPAWTSSDSTKDVIAGCHARLVLRSFLSGG
jgi:hypothetical protein